MNAKAKIFLIGTSIGLIFLYATWQLYLKPSTKENEQPVITDENIETAATAYGLALQENAPEAELQDLNRTFAKDFGLKVFKRDDKIVVTNLSGREIKIV